MKVIIPPLKIQGIKSKLIPLIKDNIPKFDNNYQGYWIEPFMGSGVVGFNLAPFNAIFADSNPHIINFYNSIKNKTINHKIVREFLETEGLKLLNLKDEYYYEVRKRFNKFHNPLDFLFLNRCCFNGMMRFNKNYDFNVPFCHKPNRFSKAYITKITNQVFNVERLILNNNWSFVCLSFNETLKLAKPNDFVYCDPPYIGRSVDYYDSWNESLEELLSNLLSESKVNFMLSTWIENIYRKNIYIDRYWKDCKQLTYEHFYHLGAKEKNRNKMVEGILLNY